LDFRQLSTGRELPTPAYEKQAGLGETYHAYLPPPSTTDPVLKLYPPFIE